MLRSSSPSELLDFRPLQNLPQWVSLSLSQTPTNKVVRFSLMQPEIDKAVASPWFVALCDMSCTLDIWVCSCCFHLNLPGWGVNGAKPSYNLLRSLSLGSTTLRWKLVKKFSTRSTFQKFSPPDQVFKYPHLSPRCTTRVKQNSPTCNSPVVNSSFFLFLGFFELAAYNQRDKSSLIERMRGSCFLRTSHLLAAQREDQEGGEGGKWETGSLKTWDWLERVQEF